MKNKKASTESSMLVIISLVATIILLLALFPTGKTFTNMIASLFNKEDSSLSGEAKEMREELETFRAKYPSKPVSEQSLKLLEKYDEVISSSAAETNLDPYLIKATILQESGGNPKAVSKTGAVGMIQLMPDTARELGLKVPSYALNKENIFECNDKTPAKCKSDPSQPDYDQRFDPILNIQAGSRYLRQQMDLVNGDIELALASYNWGLSRVQSNCQIGKGIASCGFIPDETKNYVPSVLGYYSTLSA